MISFKSITLEDQELIRGYAKGIGISYYSFTTLYIWRSKFYHEYAILDDALCIIGKTEGGMQTCFFPLGSKDLARTVERLTDHFKELQFMPLGREMAAQLEAAMPGEFEFTRLPDYADYVYETQKLAELSGKKYHAKRNFANRFEQAYEYEYIPMTADNAPLCGIVEGAWLARQESPDFMMTAESEGIGQLVKHFDELRLKGALLSVDGKIIAFSIGEYLTPDMAHIIAEKADTSYTGAYAVINRDFVKNAWSDTKYINREEDMGEPGLRQAKLSYHPAFQNEIFVARRIR